MCFYSDTDASGGMIGGSERYTVSFAEDRLCGRRRPLSKQSLRNDAPPGCSSPYSMKNPTSPLIAREGRSMCAVARVRLRDADGPK